MRPSEAPPGTSSLLRPLPSLAAILAACVLVYWLGLGSTGLSMSEGHRVVPAWEMLDTGNWLTTRMFGELYFRKPPGMMWAIAASSALFGQTEFAARAVSALACSLMAVAAWAFARRWFGAAPALLAGLAQALSPFLWESGRSAEIEALHTLFIQLACLGVLDAARRTAASGRPWPPAAAAAAFLGVLGAMLTKGPAGLPAVGGCILAGFWLSGRRPAGFALSLLPLLGGLLLSATILGFLSKNIHAAGPVVTQSPGEFLWDTSKLASILTLPLVGAAIALPASLALLLTPRARAFPAAITLAAVLALAIFTVSGVSNPRYTLPALPLWPMALAGAIASRPPRSLRPWLAGAAILALAGLTMSIVTDRARAGSGGRGSARPAGEAIAQALAQELPPNTTAEIWADGAIEARPEMLLYARRAAQELHRTLVPRWSSASLQPFTPPPEAYVLVRVEGTTVEAASELSGRHVVWQGICGKFEVALYSPRNP